MTGETQESLWFIYYDNKTEVANFSLQANANLPPVFAQPDARNCFYILKWLKNRSKEN